MIWITKCSSPSPYFSPIINIQLFINITTVYLGFTCSGVPLPECYQWFLPCWKLYIYIDEGVSRVNFDSDMPTSSRVFLTYDVIEGVFLHQGEDSAVFISGVFWGPFDVAEVTSVSY